LGCRLKSALPKDRRGRGFQAGQRRTDLDSVKIQRRSTFPPRPCASESPAAWVAAPCTEFGRYRLRRWGWCFGCSRTVRRDMFATPTDAKRTAAMEASIRNTKLEHEAPDSVLQLCGVEVDE
jgi:hypothetical protein